MNSSTPQEHKAPITQQIDYFKILRILWSRWYWIASVFTLCLICAYIYLWYTPKTYTTTSSLKFDEKKNEISELMKGKYSIDITKSIDAESFVIKSNQLLTNAIGRLDYKVSYYIIGRFRTKEMYPFKPFDIAVLKEDTLNAYQGSIYFKKINAKNFELKIKEADNDFIQNGTFNKPFLFKGYTLLIRDPLKADEADYYFKINSKENLLDRVGKGLLMKETSKGSNILALSQIDENPYFARDILNAIMHEYVFFDQQNRSQSATQTINFINSQLNNMANELAGSQNKLKDFKTGNRLLTFGSYSEIRQKKFSAYNTEIVALKNQNISLDIFEQQIKNNQDSVYLNFNLEGETGGFLKGLTEKLNTLLIEKSGKLVTYNENSKPILELDKQIFEIKEAIIRNIKSYRDRQNRLQTNLEKELRKADTEMMEVPTTELAFLNLQRTYDINEKVFSYLSEKKLEAEIARSAILPGVSVVNLAPLSYKVVEPQSARVYSTAGLIGLILSIGLVVLVRIINPYIYDKETVEALTSMPIIGVVKKFPTKLDKSNKQVLSLEKPKSIFAESIRSVRTNLSFLASEKNSKVICITSEISGEGKSFMTINLASTLSLIDKKVVVIAADLRKSKMHKAFEVDNDKGLSTYLSHQHEIEDVLKQTHVESLDFIPSGPNPPNPSELIQSERMKVLIEYLSEKYDYVLIDTAPIGLVSDSIPLIRNSDINLFVIRSGISRINAASIPDKISREYNLNNVVIVLNAFGLDSLYTSYYSSNYENSYYGNSYYYSDYSSNYGYGYLDDDKPKWWDLASRIKFYLKQSKDS